ncbi:MAG: NAD(P)/FAD-dependent oxidoreductase [Lachnospiraceae bacterium]|nr:NAD(P)/FAD-dependent oxidoreductase [Lachnospiraceae bacterium]
MKQVVVIGAGAAGLMAACAAAENGHTVTILEQNEKAGKKIYITGKGRCNFTNTCDLPVFFDHVVTNPRFLYSALYAFDQQDAMRFFEDHGCPVKVERGDRAFPVSDHASDITATFLRVLKQYGVKILYHTKVTKILTEDTPERRITGVEYLSQNGKKETLSADAVILCTGGASYPSTGADGSGYRFGEALGLKVQEGKPSLVPLVTGEAWTKKLQGLALKNVTFTVFAPDHKPGKRKKVFSEFGEMLFTHFGVSGPIVLSASCHLDFDNKEVYPAEIDLKPALDHETLLNRLLRECESAPDKHLASILRKLAPSSLAEEIAALYFEMHPDKREKPVRTFVKKEREDLTTLLKHLPLTITGSRGFGEAIITRGGIDVRQINPSTMEVKTIRGLYIAGELLDVDAYTGGFNLQIAWSTGHLAGTSVS